MYTYLTSIWPCFYILVYILSGADVDASGAKGRTILFIAVLESSLNCMELLLKNGCKTNVRDNHGFTILKTIFKTNSIIKAEAIKLLQKFGQLKLLYACGFYFLEKSCGIKSVTEICKLMFISGIQ